MGTPMERLAQALGWKGVDGPQTTALEYLVAFHVDLVGPALIADATAEVAHGLNEVVDTLDRMGTL